MGKGEVNIYNNVVEKARESCSCGRSGEKCSCAKVWLVFLSILIMLCGLAALALRVWLHFDSAPLDNLLEEIKFTYTETALVYKYVWYTLYLAICLAVSIYIVLAGIFGLVFAFQQTKRFYVMSMVASIFACLLCLVIGIGLPVIATVQPYNQVLLTYRYMQKADFGDTKNTFWAGVNQQQSEFSCCGVTGPEDYSVVNFYGKYGIYYPYSCCKLMPGVSPKESFVQADVQWTDCIRGPRAALHNMGCGDKIKAEEPEGVTMLKYIYGPAIGIAILLILSVIVAVNLYIHPT